MTMENANDEWTDRQMNGQTGSLLYLYNLLSGLLILLWHSTDGEIISIFGVHSSNKSLALLDYSSMQMEKITPAKATQTLTCKTSGISEAKPFSSNDTSRHKAYETLSTLRY